jgi:hypothetical protein
VILAVGSIHLISAKGRADIDDLLASEQERVGLEAEAGAKLCLPEV